MLFVGFAHSFHVVEKGNLGFRLDAGRSTSSFEKGLRKKIARTLFLNPF